MFRCHKEGVLFGQSAEIHGRTSTKPHFLPTSVSIEKDCKLDAVSIFSSLKDKFPGECFLLESIEGPRKVARYSFIGVEPISVFKSRDGLVEIDGEAHEVENPYEALR